MTGPRTSAAYYRDGGVAPSTTVAELADRLGEVNGDGNRLLLSSTPAQTAAELAQALVDPVAVIDGHGLWINALATAVHNAVARWADAPERSELTALQCDLQRLTPLHEQTAGNRLIHAAFDGAFIFDWQLAPIERGRVRFRRTVILHGLHPEAARRFCAWRDQLWCFRNIQLFMIAPPEDRDHYLSGTSDSWCLKGGVWTIR